MVTHNMFQNTWTGVEYRLEICRATRSNHTEIYYGRKSEKKILEFPVASNGAKLTPA
jgi:hypothetical protein